MSRIRSIHPGLWTDAAKSVAIGSHLYVLQEGEAGPVKVGIARNAFWRRMDLQSGNYRPLQLRAVYLCESRVAALLAEAAVHSAFAGAALSGEWLSTAPTQIIEYIDREIVR